MNTIPIIFDERQISRTVLGGQQAMPETTMDVSVILLNSSGSHFRIQMIENLVHCGFASIVSIEPNPENVNIEDNSRRFPMVRFIVPLEPVTDGDMINIGMSEVHSNYVLVLRDTLAIPAGLLTPRLADNLVKSGIYCIAPRLIDPNKQGVAVKATPYAENAHVRMEQSAVVTEGAPTVYPFDYIGLYNRMKFIQLGGFDYTILSPYYQNLDLALRSWLWGERTELSPSLLLTYAEDVPVEDVTVDLTYLHFYLKNILPVYHLDHGIIPRSSFFRFLRNSSCGLFEAQKQFNDAEQWTKKNRYRFKTDIQHLIEEWGTKK